MKVWSKFLVKLTTLIKNALGLKDNGTSALLLDDTMFAISFDLYCGTVNSRGKKKKKKMKEKEIAWTLRIEPCDARRHNSKIKPLFLHLSNSQETDKL